MINIELCTHTDAIEFVISPTSGMSFRCIDCGDHVTTIPPYIVDALGLPEAVTNDPVKFCVTRTSDDIAGAIGITMNAA